MTKTIEDWVHWLKGSMSMEAVMETMNYPKLVRSQMLVACDMLADLNIRKAFIDFKGKTTCMCFYEQGKQMYHWKIEEGPDWKKVPVDLITAHGLLLAHLHHTVALPAAGLNDSDEYAAVLFPQEEFLNLLLGGGVVHVRKI